MLLLKLISKNAQGKSLGNGFHIKYKWAFNIYYILDKCNLTCRLCLGKMLCIIICYIKFKRLNGEQCDVRMLGGDFNENYL